jgi:hypothetical protein
MLITLVWTTLDAVNLVWTTDDRRETAKPANTNSPTTIKNLLTDVNYWSPTAIKKASSSASNAELSLRQLLNAFSVVVRHWVYVAKRFGQYGGLISKGQKIRRLTLDKEAVHARSKILTSNDWAQYHRKTRTSRLPRSQHISHSLTGPRITSSSQELGNGSWYRPFQYYFHIQTPHCLMSTLILCRAAPRHVSPIIPH